tara:strand:+ start:46945 stop:47445 length:501 start_codon:yes stop_codon:yes gene_type:complete
MAILFIVIILALIAPKEYNVSRSVIVNKALPEVFTYLKSLKNQDNWSPWGEKDPNMEKFFSGVDGEIGFISAWKGNKEVGEGEQEIINVLENQLIELQLRFLKPFKSTSEAYIKVNEDKNGTQVIWGFSGKNKFPISIMMLFMNMEKSVGKDFEYGLNKLKGILEK